MRNPGLPAGCQFAFTIVDDTDFATVSNAKPVYDLLASLGLLTTKTVWPLRCQAQNTRDAHAQTLEDSDYARWVIDLSRAGFEIAFHGASGESNTRERTIQGLKTFSEVLGLAPRLHTNHSSNEDNLYWGPARFESRLVRGMVRLASRRRAVRFVGHVPGTPYYWGDIFESQLTYCRNLSFVGQLDITALNPTLPYHDPKRDKVPRWFSSCDGGTPPRLVALLHPRNIRRLQERRGVAIVYTHFGAGFVRSGRVVPEVEVALRRLASTPGGWFVPASALLDHLTQTRSENRPSSLPDSERSRMELSWLASKLVSGGTS